MPREQESGKNLFFKQEEVLKTHADMLRGHLDELTQGGAVEDRSEGSEEQWRNEIDLAEASNVPETPRTRAQVEADMVLVRRDLHKVEAKLSKINSDFYSNRLSSTERYKLITQNDEYSNIKTELMKEYALLEEEMLKFEPKKQ